MKTVIIDGIEYTRATPINSPVRIVVLQRGWVVVGYYQESSDNQHMLLKSKVIRRWGTTKGLGELINGPTDDTILDDAGTVRFHPLSVVLTIDADCESWSNLL